MSKIHFPSGRPYYKFIDISRKICSHFDGPVSMARVNKVSISLNHRLITDGQDLSVEIARKRLENDERTLALFKKALVVTKDFMEEKLEEPYSYKLDLGKLLSVRLASRGYQTKVDSFLAAPDLDFMRAFSILREIDAVKRDYDRPIDKFKRHLSWTIEEVNKLTEKYFCTAIRDANDSGMLLKFGGLTVISNESLAEKMFEKGIEKDGRTFCLFQKAVYDTTVIVFNNSGKKLKFTLNIAVLMPGSLFKKGINHKEIDDIIDDHGYKKTIKFLFTVGALDIEEEKKYSPDGSELPLKNLPELSYPERL
jgi:hypothetical protein